MAKSHPPELKALARLMKKEGRSLREIAEALKVPRATASWWTTSVKFKGWTARREADLMLALMCVEQKPGETFTLEEIGDRMGMTRERIRQIQDAALKKLRRRLVAAIPNADERTAGELLAIFLSSGPPRGRTGASNK
jgi:DNA-binding MarR family transcriptional regulator